MRLLETLLPLLREREHAHGIEIRKHARAFADAVCQPGQGPAVREVLERALAIFLDRGLDDSPLNNARFWIIAQIAVPLLRIGTCRLPPPVATVFVYFILILFHRNLALQLLFRWPPSSISNTAQLSPNSLKPNPTVRPSAKSKYTAIFSSSYKF